MNILYLGYFCNELFFNQLVNNGSKGSHARQQLEAKLLNGMIKVLNGDKMDIISYLPEVKSMHCDVGEDAYYDINIKYLWCNKKKINSILKALLKNIYFIAKWSKGKKEKVILTYSANPVHIIPAFLLRRICNIKVVTLCSEVSIYRRKDNINFIGKMSRKISSFLDNSFDGYILLTEGMNEIINKKAKPYLIMEGIAEEQKVFDRVIKKMAILYAGGLTPDNGIEILLEGFLQLDRKDIELWICGDGPLENMVKDYSKMYKNIIFYGIIPNDVVQEMEKEVVLLISPRFSKNEFTKYSFPSKTIEYMSSGTPTVLTCLQGIPDEYFKYTYLLEDETSAGIKCLLEKIFEEDINKREGMGAKAREFVLRNKSSVIQGKRVIHFMKDVVELKNHCS
ncbi:MAG: glycosyltransferase [Lacrimispora sp.]|uniref:glycosyltransferase n=1 Tax=Lacrimispora sp. TaxID=2719234 RepID=UPI0039E5137C